MLDNKEDGEKPIWVFDNRVKSNPISIATFPEPADRDYVAVGGHFGPHNIYENRASGFVSEELIFATYQNAGRARLRHPRQVPAGGSRQPACRRRRRSWWTRGRTGRWCCIPPTCSSDSNGICYCTDFSAGLYIVEYKG